MRKLFAAFAAAVFLIPAGFVRAQDVPFVAAFAPAIGVEKLFDVAYRLQDVREGRVIPATGVNYRMAVTPLEVVGDGYRVRVLVTGFDRPPDSGDGMDMIVAAAQILETEAFELLVDYRGIPQTVLDFRAVNRRLTDRADALQNPITSMIARSVVDFHDEDQLASRVADALVRMGLGFHYLLLAQEAGSAAISWFGRPYTAELSVDAAGRGVAVEYASGDTLGPGGPAVLSGTAVIGPDGWAETMTDYRNRGDARFLTQAVTTVTAVAPAR